MKYEGERGELSFLREVWRELEATWLGALSSPEFWNSLRSYSWECEFHGLSHLKFAYVPAESAALRLPTNNQ